MRNFGKILGGLWGIKTMYDALADNRQPTHPTYVINVKFAVFGWFDRDK